MKNKILSNSVLKFMSSWITLLFILKLISHTTNAMSAKEMKELSERSKEMFYHAYNFNGDLSNWAVSSVTTMSGMFCYSSFNILIFDIK